jgi:hypothetical protein
MFLDEGGLLFRREGFVFFFDAGFLFFLDAGFFFFLDTGFLLLPLNGLFAFFFPLRRTLFKTLIRDLASLKKGAERVNDLALLEATVFLFAIRAKLVLTSRTE